MEKTLKNIAFEVITVLLSFATSAYFVTYIFAASRHEVRAESGQLPNMDPEIAYAIVLLFGVIAIVAIIIIETIRHLSYKGSTLNFYESAVLGVIMSFFVVVLLFIPELSSTTLLITTYFVSLSLFYALRALIYSVKHNKSLKEQAALE